VYYQSLVVRCGSFTAKRSLFEMRTRFVLTNDPTTNEPTTIHSRKNLSNLRRFMLTLYSYCRNILCYRAFPYYE
jgi:hypothetical protein